MSTDYWRTGRAFFAAGFRPCHVIHNTFSYHFTPAGAMVDSGARAIGCAVFPAGVGNTELQIQAIRDVRPRYYAGTPSFLKILLETAREMDADVSSVKIASVAGEGLSPGLRADIKALGVDAYQWYGTADLGLIAYETPAMEGLIVDECVIVEIVRPGTGDGVPDGEVGEVVVTTFNRRIPADPLRHRRPVGGAAGVRARAGAPTCGSRAGWAAPTRPPRSRACSSTPPRSPRWRSATPRSSARAWWSARSSGRDVMTLHCESRGADAAAVAETLQAVCKLKGRVELAAPDTLPNDGKIIDDTRPLA